MKVAELLTEEFDRHQDGANHWKELQAMCRDLHLTIQLPNAANPVGHNKAGANMSGKVRVRRDIKAAKQLDQDERELTLRLFRTQLARWLKGKMAEGRSIGHSFKKLVTNADELVPAVESDSNDDPYVKFDIFIGYPPEMKAALDSTYILCINSYEVRDLSKPRKHGSGFEAVRVTTCTQFSTEEVRNKVRRTLNAARTAPLTKLKFLADLARATGSHFSRPGFEYFKSVGSKGEHVALSFDDPEIEELLRQRLSSKFASPLLQTSNERIYQPTDVSEDKFLGVFNHHFPGVIK